MNDEESERFWAWRDAERHKRRTMTVGEYAAWCRGGDAVSSHTEVNPFPGGLTITFGASPIIGRTSTD